MPEWLNGVVLKAIIEEIRGFKSYSTWVEKEGGDCSSMVEQENFNLLVVGSSPISPIKRKRGEKRGEGVHLLGGREIRDPRGG